MTPSRAYLAFLQDYNTYTTSYFFTGFNNGWVRELEADRDRSVQEYLEQLKAYCLDENGRFGPQNIEDISQCLGELRTYCILKNLYQTCRIPEAKEKRPDFKAIVDRQEVYIEVKTPTIFEPQLNTMKILSDGLDSKAETDHKIQELRKAGTSGIVFSENTIAPYVKDGEEYCPDSPCFVIDRLLGKLVPLYKPGQCALGPTIYWYNLDHLAHLGYKVASHLPHAVVASNELLQSGVCWHLAFGRRGMPVWQDSHHAVDGYMSKSGLLVTSDSQDQSKLCGVIFQFNESFICGFYRHQYTEDGWRPNQSVEMHLDGESPPAVVQLITDSCSFHNDEFGYIGFPDGVRPSVIIPNIVK